MLTHLLDTSAWLTHLFREPGYADISKLFLEPGNQVGVSVISLVEVHSRLRALKIEHRFEQVVAEYRELFAQILPVDEPTALRAASLRQSAGHRVPAIDAVIAAAASLQSAVLVHRDPHFAAVPGELLQQQALPAD